MTGSLFRAKRVALGLGVQDLGLTPRGAIHLLKLEQDRVQGDLGWYESLIHGFLSELVTLCKQEGHDVYSLRLNPWSAREILTAWRKA